MRFRTRQGAVDGRHRPSRARRRAFAALVAVVVAFGLVTARLFVWPAQGMPTSVDAIVMLAGPGNRLPVALQLAREHRAPVLVVSRGWEGYGGPCPSPVPGVKLICFDPDPPDTRGEAEFTRQAGEAIPLEIDSAGDLQDAGHSRSDHCGALLRRLHLCGHGTAAARQLAIRDRLPVGRASQGAGPGPGLLSCGTTAELRYTSSLTASASGAASRSRDDMIVTGMGQGMARSGSSNAIDTSSVGS